MGSEGCTPVVPRIGSGMWAVGGAAPLTIWSSLVLMIVVLCLCRGGVGVERGQWHLLPAHVECWAIGNALLSGRIRLLLVH